MVGKSGQNRNNEKIFGRQDPLPIYGSTNHDEFHEIT